MIKGFVAEVITIHGDALDSEAFATEVDAKAHYEELILEWEDEKDSIDYITIYYAEDKDGECEELDDLGIGSFVKNIETYTYD